MKTLLALRHGILWAVTNVTVYVVDSCYNLLIKTCVLASETELISGGSDKQLILWEWNGTGRWNNQVSRNNLFLKLLPLVSHATNYLFFSVFLMVFHFTLAIEPCVYLLQLVILSCYVLLKLLFLLFCSLYFSNHPSLRNWLTSHQVDLSSMSKRSCLSDLCSTFL